MRGSYNAERHYRRHRQPGVGGPSDHLCRFVFEMMTTQQPLTEVQSRISQHLMRSAGNANWPTDNLLGQFLSMIDSGEATMEDMQRVGGQWLVNQLEQVKR